MTEHGERDLDRAREDLAGRLPPSLAPFAWLAYNYRWSWHLEGPGLFGAIDPHRWALCRQNPVRLLQEAAPGEMARAARDPDLLGRVERLVDDVRADLARPLSVGSAERPVAFLCAEYGVHGSLPTYSGGLGVLAGDILKEASDRALPLVGVGILYRQGYFHQRVDRSGWQHEYWIESDPDRLPAALVTGPDGLPLTIAVPLRGRDVTVQVWRVDVGRIPLFLLDTQRAENSRSDRWITARLYVGDRKIRLAQYALLGIGGIQALKAMGFDPAVVHMNEGHAALAPLELALQDVRAGRSFEEALEAARERTVFTTHTPVAAGNETYTAEEVAEVLGDFPSKLGVDEQRFLGLGRAHPEDQGEPLGLTPLGIRVSQTSNGVSEVHGRVARGMWHHLFPDRPVEEVPIGHVTNGVHLPTWMALPMQALLDRHLEPGWRERQADPATWRPVFDIPDQELWAVRSELRSSLVAYVRDRSVGDRLAREEPSDYAEAAANAFSPDVLTLGFARRVAGYKRLDLLVHDPGRAVRLLEEPDPIQLVLAGKAHPADEMAKRILQTVFGLKWQPHVSERVAFLEDYDMAMAARLVSGCDVWVNVPRPPLEASGTSGMKAALNGALNLSVLDGWWSEAYDGTNGWAIEGDPALDVGSQDDRDAASLFGLLEEQVVPLFYARGPDGVPTEWVRRVKASLVTCGPRFSASRMIEDYLAKAYHLA